MILLFVLIRASNLNTSFYSPSTFATSYEWSCNNPINDSDTSHPTIAISLGDQIVLKVTDHNGCKVIDTLELTNHPSLSVQAPNDTVICIGDSLQLYTSIIDSVKGLIRTFFGITPTLQ